jgi:hypothetical protein
MGPDGAAVLGRTHGGIYSNTSAVPRPPTGVGAPAKGRRRERGEPRGHRGEDPAPAQRPHVRPGQRPRTPAALAPRPAQRRRGGAAAGLSPRVPGPGVGGDHRLTPGPGGRRPLSGPGPEGDGARRAPGRCAAAAAAAAQGTGTTTAPAPGRSGTAADGPTPHARRRATRTRRYSRGSTGSDSRASTANTASCTRHSGSPSASRSSASSPSAYSRRASERLWPRWR